MRQIQNENSMPVAWTLSVISKTGHHYEVKVTPMPHKKTRAIDPCDAKCYQVFEREADGIIAHIKNSYRWSQCK